MKKIELGENIGVGWNYYLNPNMLIKMVHKNAQHELYCLFDIK
jgi:hypothetical protein